MSPSRQAAQKDAAKPIATAFGHLKLRQAADSDRTRRTLALAKSRDQYSIAYGARLAVFIGPFLPVSTLVQESHIAIYGCCTIVLSLEQ